ncbi:MAG: hypothetical protein WCJ13_06115 [Coriobacteriia bacterium]
MGLTPLVKTLIIMNNYFHDVATAMLFASALIMWMLGKRAEHDGADMRKWFPGTYDVLSKIAFWSIVWIVIGGIPRTIFFQQVEWNLADPSNKYLFIALMIKHAMMWIFVVVGGIMWWRMRAVAKGAEGVR